MVLVFCLCVMIILITLFIVMIFLSTMHFKVENFKLSNMHKNIEKSITPNYKVKVELYLFNKIKWFGIRLNDKKIRKIYGKIQLEKINIKKLEQEFKLEDLKELKEIKPKISLLHLQLNIGTEDAILTSFLVCGISIALSILLTYTIKQYQRDRCKYEVKPIYINQNVYEVKLDCIIEIKMVHIINIIYIFIKKRRVDKNERTSNRGSYGYSYE